MNHKIIVEDHTKPPDKDEIMDGLANVLTIYASSVGINAGLSQNEITVALIQAAEEMARYMVILEKATDEEIATMRERAINNAKKRLEILSETGVTDLAKRIAKVKENE